MNGLIGVGIVLASCIAALVYMYRKAPLKPDDYEDWPPRNIKGGEANDN